MATPRDLSPAAKRKSVWCFLSHTRELTAPFCDCVQPPAPAFYQLALRYFSYALSVGWTTRAAFARRGTPVRIVNSEPFEWKKVDAARTSTELPRRLLRSGWLGHIRIWQKLLDVLSVGIRKASDAVVPESRSLGALGLPQSR